MIYSCTQSDSTHFMRNSCKILNSVKNRSSLQPWLTLLMITAESMLSKRSVLKMTLDLFFSLISCRPKLMPSSSVLLCTLHSQSHYTCTLLSQSLGYTAKGRQRGAVVWSVVFTTTMMATSPQLEVNA